MKKLTRDIVEFFHNQPFVIISTIDEDGSPHNSCKGIIDIDENGRVYLLDLYRGRTYANLLKNHYISVTAVDEHRFRGYSLKGKAGLMKEGDLTPQVIKAWEDRIAGRITQRVIKNIQGGKGHPRHPEVLLPKPEYMIMMEVDEIVDLTPHHLKEGK